MDEEELRKEEKGGQKERSSIDIKRTKGKETFGSAALRKILQDFYTTVMDTYVVFQDIYIISSVRCFKRLHRLPLREMAESPKRKHGASPVQRARREIERKTEKKRRKSNTILFPEI